MPEREFTPKEQKVVDTFEEARPGLGAMPSAVRSRDHRTIQHPQSQLRLAGNHCRHA